MNEISILSKPSSTATITTLEIAEMMGVEHKEILKKLDGTTKPDGSVKQVGIIPVLTRGNFPLSDYFQISSYKDSSGKDNKCYMVTKLGCDFLANKFTGEKGIIFTARYVKRFNEMEQSLIPKDYPSALRLAADEYEKRMLAEKRNAELEKKIEQDRPKTIFADAVSVSNTSILIGELAKILKQNGVNIGQNRLFDWMRKNGYLINRKGMDYNMPMQKSMELGLFEIKERAINNPDGTVRITKTVLVTGKGQQYFINKFLGNSEAA